ncbi:MAG: GAF domain-containing protein [Anaerolineales bacterium]|nr:GAF domain-containing protein [Anaerolineales bacterium]
MTNHQSNGRFSEKSMGKTLTGIVFLYQALAAVVLVWGVVVAIQWTSEPFIGSFYEHSLVFTDVGPLTGEWEFNAAVKSGDQLLAVNGTEVKSGSDVRNTIVGKFEPGESVTLTVLFADGGSRNVTVELQRFPQAGVVVYFFLPTVLSIIFLMLSIWTFGLRRNEPAGRAFTMFASSFSIVTGTIFNLWTTHELSLVWTYACAIAGGATIALALSFPSSPRILINRPYLRWVGFLISLILAGAATPWIFNTENPTTYISQWRDIYYFDALSIFILLGVNLYYAIYAQSPVVKLQARSTLIGALIAFAPLTIFLTLGAVFDLPFSPWLFLPVVVFPAIMGYNIMRFRFLRSDDLARRGVMYALLSVLVIVGYSLVITGLGLFFSDAMPSNNPYLVGAALFVIAIALDPIRTRLQNLVDSLFFRGSRVVAEQLEDFSHKLTTTLDLNTIGALLRDQIASTLTSQIHVFTYDSLNDFYSALPGDDRRPTSDIRFTSGSPLVGYFSKEHLPLYLDNASSLPDELKPEQSRLTLLGARLFIVFPGKDRPNGWLALGPRLTGQAYSPRDLRFLENICDQASVAIERVQTVAHLERRIQEMNALTRVSQGVNVTLTFDDVLELIYAQTAQIVPTSHFHITLYNKDSDYYYYGFCLENSERIHERENQPFSANVGLSPEVIRKSRPIITQDYIRECQARNHTPAIENIFAWIGVPLNAGAESIGTLSVGSRDGSTIYTRAQLELLQAIADQTAGAIVKARLLQETQERAHQLSTLNEITRQLTSTLELNPLLQNILENAVGILNCEAGSLFLVDDQTDELVFRVTVGPVASNLIGKRLPPGTGIVGRAVQTRGAVIENEEQNNANRFKGVDQQTGFVSRSLMAVPLQVKDRVIGVIEVINRRDGLPFVQNDQTLLNAFAGQAAVAIENARLYTLTDQELASRVEELSVMQRIDRELNASLEMDRAMRITLDWALRQSDAEAGLIGILEESKLRIMAHQGLDEQMQSLPDQTMKIELPSMISAVETGLPQKVEVEVESARNKLLVGAQTQMVIPIRRETTVIGLLYLESTGDTTVDIDFLTRLTDHAAIAISNAQLFSEVQRANLAKSDFVSFVAHELKNPMTSIKGYTELLASGAVGQITEMQANFLQTIKSNVERMSTLVSDLNDNSKIEAGRLRLEYKATKADDLVDEVIRTFKRQLEDKKQNLDLNVPSDLPPMWADRIRVGQVLTNLVSNAFKYTPEGGQVIVGVEETPNHWDADGAPRVIHLWVKDNGIGMTAEDQQKIFQKFFRSDDPKAREAPGTGLGLNITKSLVEMQGGKIWFDSEYRKGTTFHFTVPVAQE